MFSIPYRSLKEAVRQDRGVVVYDDGQVIVCDWAEACPRGGLPVLSWRGGLRPSIEDEYHSAILETNRVAVDDIRSVLSDPLDRGSLYDPNGALSRLLSGDEPKNCVAHEVRCYGLTAIVLAPSVWRVRDWSAAGRVVFVQRRVAYKLCIRDEGVPAVLYYLVSEASDREFAAHESTGACRQKYILQ
jgi:hypothetical protein